MRHGPVTEARGGEAGAAPRLALDLRALDWRYLLPRPTAGRFAHLALFGAAPGVAALARTARLAERVTEGDGAGDADAVVALRNGGWSPAQIARALGRDAVLYAESRGPWGAMRGLGVAGVEVTGRYAVAGGDGGYRSFVPLGSEGALPWLLRTRHVAPTPAAVLREHAARVLGALGARGVLGGGAGVAITGAKGTYRGAPPAALAAARACGVSAAATPLLLCAGGDRVVCLPFAPGEPAPALVVKIPRSPAFGARTAAERATMSAVRDALPGDLAMAVAEPRCEHEDDGVACSVERYLPGTMLMRTCGRWAPGQAAGVVDLALAAGWLTRFHLATVAARARWGDDAHRPWRTGSMEEFRQCFGASGDTAALFALAERASAAAADILVPVVCAHRDFTVWNLARDGETLRVMDWEGARAGAPLADLLHLLTSWFHVTRFFPAADGDARGFELTLAALTGERTTPPVAAEVVARYGDALALDRRLRLPLAVHFALELAVRRAALLRSHGHPDVASPEANPYLTLVAVLARHRERLAAASAGS